MTSFQTCRLDSAKELYFASARAFGTRDLIYFSNILQAFDTIRTEIVNMQRFEISKFPSGGYDKLETKWFIETSSTNHGRIKEREKTPTNPKT